MAGNDQRVKRRMNRNYGRDICISGMIPRSEELGGNSLYFLYNPAVLP